MLGRVFVFSCGSVGLVVAEKPDTNTRHLFFSPRYRGRNLVALLQIVSLQYAYWHLLFSWGPILWFDGARRGVRMSFLLEKREKGEKGVVGTDLPDPRLSRSSRPLFLE